MNPSIMVLSASGALAVLSHFVAPAFVTALLISMLRRPARHWGLVDRPGGRKLHEGAIPLVGGIGMAAGYIVTMLLTSRFTYDQQNLLVGLAMLVALGVLDDFRELSAKKKLVWQLAAAAVIVVPGAEYLYHLGDLVGMGRIELGWFALPFTLFAIVGLINAVNMSDGIDGLAGGLVMTSAVWMAVLAVMCGFRLMVLELLQLMAVTLGFLVFNLRTPIRTKAAVFMGDAGSMMLGACLSWFAIHLTQFPAFVGENPPPVVILWVLGLPVLDTVVLMLRRLHQGRSPFSAGRDHMHHIWTHAGFSIAQTTVCLTVVNLLLGAIGVIGWRLGVPEWLLTAGYVGVFLLHRELAKHAWRVSTWLRVHKPHA